LYGCETWSLTLRETDWGCLEQGAEENIWTWREESGGRL
jgi:hypothetical protein